VTESRYIHGTAKEEQARLSRLNQLLNEAALREMNIRRGDLIVDFGCGLAQLTRAMARAAGVRAVGLERSAEQIAEALRQARSEGEDHLLELRESDVLGAQVERSSYDIAHARFVLEHVPDPLAVVTAMVRAVRRGGRIILQDDDHDVLRIWPEPPGLRALWQAYMRTYDRLGNDPIVGRRLVSLLHEAGAAPVRSTWIYFGCCAAEANWAGFVENLHSQLAGAREAMLKGGLLGAAEIDAALAAFLEWSRRPEAAIWYAVCWAEGVRR
jgi:SAM-dependent methyltransferase